MGLIMRKKRGCNHGRGYGDREVSLRGRKGNLTVERDGSRLVLVGVERERRRWIGAVWMKGFSR